MNRLIFKTYLHVEQPCLTFGPLFRVRLVIGFFGPSFGMLVLYSVVLLFVG